MLFKIATPTSPLRAAAHRSFGRYSPAWWPPEVTLVVAGQVGKALLAPSSCTGARCASAASGRGQLCAAARAHAASLGRGAARTRGHPAARTRATPPLALPELDGEPEVAWAPDDPLGEAQEKNAPVAARVANQRQPRRRGCERQPPKRGEKPHVSPMAAAPHFDHTPPSYRAACPGLLPSGSLMPQGLPRFTGYGRSGEFFSCSSRTRSRSWNGFAGNRLRSQAPACALVGFVRLEQEKTRGTSRTPVNLAGPAA